MLKAKMKDHTEKRKLGARFSSRLPGFCFKLFDSDRANELVTDKLLILQGTAWAQCPQQWHQMDADKIQNHCVVKKKAQQCVI